MAWRNAWWRRSPPPRRPAGSATARSSSSPSTPRCASAPASATATRSDTLHHSTPVLSRKVNIMANDVAAVLKRIKDEEIEWVDLRFTDPKGKWQHLTMCAGVIGEDELTDGLMFDGSSIDGWKAINESDMILKPDL